MAGLLNVGEMGALALHVMVELAVVKERDDEARRTAQELAGELHASVHTLQKVIRRLVLAGLVEGARGANGGVRLTGDAASVSMLQVLESVEGPVRANGCLFSKRVCPEEGQCRFRCMTGEMEQSIRNYFIKTTIADLCAEATRNA